MYSEYQISVVTLQCLALRKNCVFWHLGASLSGRRDLPGTLSNHALTRTTGTPFCKTDHASCHQLFCAEMPKIICALTIYINCVRLRPTTNARRFGKYVLSDCLALTTSGHKTGNPRSRFRVSAHSACFPDCVIPAF